MKNLFLFVMFLIPCLTQAEDSGMFDTTNQKLRRRLDFWISIYTKYTTDEGVIHDAKYPEIVYEKIDLHVDASDFTKSPKVRKKASQKRLEDIKNFYIKSLMSIHQKTKDSKIAATTNLTEAERRIYELYKDVDEPNKFFNAAHNKRIRFQLGQKDRFLQGLYYSGRYLSHMETVFKNKGVPVEITRLPFVESSFNLRARSKVGASGIWQFMRSTGKFFLKINDTVDERNDPIRATEGAADLLKANFDSLGSWPLAITAYNHGRKGMMRAIAKVGNSDLQDVIQNYKSRSFGFASSNFYAELMAAFEVEKNSSKYFEKVEREAPIQYSEFVMNDFVSIKDISTYCRIPLDDLIELNPGLTDQVIKVQKYVPSGYTLRIPPEMKNTFLTCYNEIPADKKFASQKNAHHSGISKKISDGESVASSIALQ